MSETGRVVYSPGYASSRNPGFRNLPLAPTLAPTQVESPEPGSRCPTCERRVPKPRRSDSPATKRIVAVLPPDRAESLALMLDGLQEIVGADVTTYPKGTLLEALCVVAGLHHREELVEFFADYRAGLEEQEQAHGA